MERPKASLRCGVMIGAKAMPKRYSERPRIAVVVETSKSVMTPEIPAVYTVAPKALGGGLST